MANSQKMQKDEDEVKYLGFLRAIVIQVVLWKLSMYEWVKDRSGPFKFIIQTVERLSIFLLTPIYNRFYNFAHLVLLFLDNKVDKMVIKLEILVDKMIIKLKEIASVLVKKIKLEALGKKAIKIVQNLIKETITSSVIDALKGSMNLLPNPFDTISKLPGATSKNPDATSKKTDDDEDEPITF